MKILKIIKPPLLMKLLSYWPPYLFSGIKIFAVNEDFTKIEVRMKQHFWNTNYVGSHFGGSLYSMCDPFFMFILLHHLPGHIIWDKGAKFKFKRPGYGTVHASFEITKDSIAQLEKEASSGQSISPIFFTSIKDAQGNVIFELEKTLYLKKKI